MSGRRNMLVVLLALFGLDAVMAMNVEERLLFANGLYRRDLYDLAVPEYQALLDDEAATRVHDLAAFRMGECYRNLGRTNEAANAYDTVISRHPDSVFVQRASFRRAEIDWLAGRLRDATGRFQGLLATQPPADIEATSRYYLGLCLSGLDQFEEAEENFRAMLDNQPGSPYADYARMALADLLKQRGGPSEEIAALLNEIADKPETPSLGAEALAKAGRLAYRRRDMNEASRLFSSLSSQYPESPWNARVQLDAAWAHLFSGKLEHARVLAGAGLASAGPEERPAWLYLMANLERQAMDARAALQFYRELLKEFPAHETAPVAAFEAAGLALQNGDHADALELADRAGGDPARELPLLWIRAGALRGLGRHPEAAAVYQRIVDAYPSSDRAPAAAYQLALMDEEKGDLAGAATAFARLADRYPQSELAPDALMAAASAYSQAGQPADAIGAWSRLAGKHPGYAGMDEALMERARAELKLERERDAARTLAGLISVHTNSRFLAEACYLRGTLYEKEEAFQEAEFHYHRALSLNPSPALAREIQHRQVAVLQRQGRHAEAADLMNNLLSSGNSQTLPSTLLEWLARWNLEQKDFPAAEAAAERLAETGETPAWRQIGAYIAGLSEQEQKKPQEAAAHFTEAAAFDLNTRETALASHQLGLLALDAKDYDAAIARFSRAAELAAADSAMDIRARSYFQLGVTHELLGNWADAGRYFLGVGVLFDDASVTPESLYRAAGALHAMQRTTDRDQVVSELRERYPGSEWSRRAAEQWPGKAADARP